MIAAEHLIDDEEDPYVLDTKIRQHVAVKAMCGVEFKMHLQVGLMGACRRCIEELQRRKLYS